MAALLIAQAAYHRRHVRRVFRDRSNPLDYMNDSELMGKYRLPRNCIEDLCATLKDPLEHRTKTNHALPVSLQVLTALRFYATGSFFCVIGDTHGVHKSTVSRCVRTVSRELCRMASDYIKYPTDRKQIQRDFYDIAEFPNVLGAVDGTQIALIRPVINEHLYVCRKGFHSINVQVICGANLDLFDVVVKFPGSSHDSYVLMNSALGQKFENGDIKGGWLLGDSGYPQTPWLMTPLLNPTCKGEMKYNRKQKTTRAVVERCIGVWKMRFRCIHQSGGSLQFTPLRSAHIILATAVLHNICVKSRLPIPEDTAITDADHENEQELPPHNNGAEVRTHLIASRFS